MGFYLQKVTLPRKPNEHLNERVVYKIKLKDGPKT